MAFDPTIQAVQAAMIATQIAQVSTSQTVFPGAISTETAPATDFRSLYVLAGAAGLTLVLSGCSEPVPQSLQHQPAHTGRQTALEACRESLHMARAERHQDDQGLFAAVLIGALIVTGISSTAAYLLGRRSGRKSQQKQAPAVAPDQTPKADGK